MLILQYAGFVSRACQRYLKKGCLLVVNKSHSDASMASIMPIFMLMAVIKKQKNRFIHSTKNLENYFIPKKDIKISEEYLERLRRGIGYTKTASNYVFRKVKQK